ncbi:MAG: biotin--[acetyl-CoA-carboxylase] ligase [Sphingomonadales bacterium]|nr:biotin--[acetyl-CoA-carboxylase] ligase [Sphingomonadales bacterium]
MSTDLTAWPEGVARHALARVDSTMAEAARLAPHLAGPAWIEAAEQTAARGRRGRAWRHPPGNLAATLVFRPATFHPGATPADLALYSFVAALALDEALARLLGPAGHLAIKWPNDVLLNGGKVAGILLESVGQGPEIASLAIGIGVNLIAAPPRAEVEEGAVPPVSVAGETGITLSPAEVLPPLAMAFDRYATQFRRYGFAPLREAWMTRAARLGERIVARIGTERHEGVLEGIDLTGAMLLRTAEGLRTIAAADVFF